MREREMQRIVQRLHWLVKARRSTGTSTTQVRAHIAHDAHGGVHLVGAHTRHFTARDAFKLGAKALREHVAAGGEAGTVAQAELDRRAEKRGGARADTVAPAPEAVAAPRRARKPKAEEPVSTLPAWVPKPKRGGRYSKDERSAFRRTLYFGEHPHVQDLIAAGAAVTAELNAWARTKQIPDNVIPHVINPDRYKHLRSVQPSTNLFADGVKESSKGRADTLDFIERGVIREQDQAKIATPAGLAQWWEEDWAPSRDYWKRSMEWWSANRHVFDPLRDPDATIEALRHGFNQNLVTEEQAQHLLQDVMKLPFIARAHNSVADGETSIRELLTTSGRKPPVSLSDAKAKYETAKQKNDSEERERSAVYHTAIVGLADAFRSLRASGKAPHHSTNLTRRFPGLKLEVQGGSKAGGWEVVAEGGPLQGAGLRIISSRKPTRAEAWQAFEDQVNAGAALDPGQHWTTYSRARPMGKARMRSIVQRLWALAKAKRYTAGEERRHADGSLWRGQANAQGKVVAVMVEGPKKQPPAHHRLGLGPPRAEGEAPAIRAMATPDGVGPVSWREAFRLLATLAPYAGPKTGKALAHVAKRYDPSVAHAQSPAEQARAIVSANISGASWAYQQTLDTKSRHALREALLAAPWSAIEALPLATRERLYAFLHAGLSNTQAARLAKRWGQARNDTTRSKHFLHERLTGRPDPDLARAAEHDARMRARMRAEAEAPAKRTRKR